MTTSYYNNVNKVKKEAVVLKYINEKDLKFFQEILEAETIGGKEYLIKDSLLEKLKSLGFKTEVDDLGNISAIRGLAKEYPMLNAHMDIVDCSWSYSSYKSSYKDYGLSSYGYNYGYGPDYENDYDFYVDICEEINITKSEHESKAKYHKEILEKLKPKFKNLTLSDLEGLDCDCIHCKKECKNMYICENFELDTTNETNVEYFLDSLEDYCRMAMDNFEYYQFESGYEEEEEEEVYENAVESNNEYEVVIDLIADKIKGKGKVRVLGGDDKCGVFIALKVAELLPDLPLKILFTVREESGCVGISHFLDNNLDFLSDVKYSLTIDRREGNNLLWSQLGTRSCDNEFAGLLSREGVCAGINVELMDGSVADVIHIRKHVPNSVNMSAGYYEAHSSSEYIVPSEVDKIIGWVKNILTNV